MTWETFYDRFYDWADSTQISNLSKLTTFGPSDEVLEIALAFLNEKAATRLIRKALAAGVRFTSEEVMELDGYVDSSLLPELAVTASTAFSPDDLEAIAFDLDRDVAKAVAKKSGLQLDEDGCVVSPDEEDEAESWDAGAVEEVRGNEEEPVLFTDTLPEKKPGWGTVLLALLSAFGAKKAGKSSRCNGDCAHCPPHYGYRYGRWYYGHHHTRGCQRGGNFGGGGMD